MPTNWDCPYCNRSCTIGDHDITEFSDVQHVAEKYGTYRSITEIIVCPNPECRQQTITLQINVFDFKKKPYIDNPLHKWLLLPESAAKLFPEYIPQAIREDYQEACLIKDKSPKASATLSRRCLQGMIRDFWKIKKNRLVDEIKALEGELDELTWQAIDGVRRIGNIGAHMEQDINLITEVEPKEAELLIGLIETLLKEWYVRDHERKQSMGKIIHVSKNKTNKKTAAPTEPKSA